MKEKKNTRAKRDNNVENIQRLCSHGRHLWGRERVLKNASVRMYILGRRKNIINIRASKNFGI
jgi:hypothetical protein